MKRIFFLLACLCLPFFSFAQKAGESRQLTRQDSLRLQQLLNGQVEIVIDDETQQEIDRLFNPEKWKMKSTPFPKKNMKFETEHGCVVSEMATAYGNSKQIGRYAIAAAMNEVLTRAERVDQMEIRVCAPLEEKKTHLYDVKAEAARCAREHGQTFWEPEIIRAAWAACTFVQVDRKSTRLNSSHIPLSRMPSSA